MRSRICNDSINYQISCTSSEAILSSHAHLQKAELSDFLEKDEDELEEMIKELLLLECSKLEDRAVPFTPFNELSSATASHDPILNNLIDLSNDDDKDNHENNENDAASVN